MSQRSRRRLLNAWTGLICSHPVLVLVLSVLTAAACVGVTWWRLGFQPNRNDLISSKLDWNGRYIHFTKNFAGNDDMTVVVAVPDGADGRARAERFVDDLSGRLVKEPHVSKIFWGYDSSKVSEAAIRLLDMKGFKEQLAFIEQVGPLLRSKNISQLIDAVQGQLTSGAGDGGMTRGEMLEKTALMSEFLRLIAASIEQEPAEKAFEKLNLGLGGWTYLATENGKLLYLQLEPRPATDALDAYGPASAAIRGHIAATRAAHPGIESGLTGVTSLEAEETEVMTRDSTVATIVAFMIISVLMLLAFHGLKMPIMAVAAMLTGIAWSFGYLTLAVGHLQVLSVAFTVMLLGLGIDFAIHIISQFEVMRHEHPDTVEGFGVAIRRTMQSTGPGILTGAVTTAAAFATTMLTDFKGMAEMGHIAAVGLLLCLLAMFAVFPAMLRLWASRTKDVPPDHARWIDMHKLAHLLRPIVDRPWAVLVCSGLVLCGLGYGVKEVYYNYNLMDIQARNMESVIWQNRILEHEKSLWYAVSIAPDLKTAERLTAAFAKLPEVDKVGGVGMLFPPDDQEMRRMIGQVRLKLADSLREEAGGGAAAAAEPGAGMALGQKIQGIGVMLRLLALPRPEVAGDPEMKAGLTKLLESSGVAAEALQKHPKADERLGKLDRQFLAWRQGLVGKVNRALEDRPLGLADLPQIVVREAISHKGESYQIKIYPRNNVWRPVDLEPFVTSLRSVDPEVTGTPFQVYESGRLITRSYQLAGLYALAAVLVLVYFDFRRIADTLLCVLPVVLAFVLLFGFMGWMRKALGAEHPWAVIFELNFANIIVLPLLFGIGVDAGVHIMHRYNTDAAEFPPGLGHGTAKGIILTTMTTMIGFAALMLSHHMGIRSLGFILTAGMGLILLICLTLMPALLELRNRFRQGRGVALARSNTLRVKEPAGP